MSMKRLWLAAPPASVLLLALATASHAQSGSTSEAGTPASSLEAQRVIRDPATGRLRAPDHEEMQQMRDAAAAKRAAPGVNALSARSAAPTTNRAEKQAQVLQRFSGSVPMVSTTGATGRRLDMSRLNFAIARRNADGSVSVSDDAAHAAGRRTDTEAAHAK